ncbi:hypothetical protein Cflav_PD5671 [Pedosphaera parvula Ellin514]|uniref:Uncharacterized protein n=1 Tax=Pedosphaera parvula (strain Ellin514) TaxID=320771 RepID=B9XAK1_PEDPL|nr:hypothetical protein Cflav_PD5671 [Pedosphaera parvula Ellin514]
MITLRSMAKDRKDVLALWAVSLGLLSGKSQGFLRGLISRPQSKVMCAEELIVRHTAVRISWFGWVKYWLYWSFFASFSNLEKQVDYLFASMLSKLNFIESPHKYCIPLSTHLRVAIGFLCILNFFAIPLRKLNSSKV